MAQRICSVDGCDKKHWGKGFCHLHYERWKRNGDPLVLQRPGGECVVEGCDRTRFCKQMCKPHYRKMEKYGDPHGGPGRGSVRQDEVARFWAKVDREGPVGCWLWTAGLNSDGYANFWLDGTTVKAARFAYELLVKPIPPGRELDHLCRVRSCVNPEHLEPVTPTVNNLRGNSAAALNARKTHCDQGHEFTRENTYLTPKGGKRHCRTCMRDRWGKVT